MKRGFLILLAALAMAAVQPVEVAKIREYCDGIVFDAQGNGYVSHGKTISKLSVDGRLTKWAETGAPAGHKILADGTHLVCDGRQRAILRLSAHGEVLGKAAAQSDGKPLRSPNDLTLDGMDGFYFTDPGGSREAAVGTIHYVSSKGKTTVVAGNLLFPNGIVLRPDGRVLYVAESRRNRILEYQVLGPGKLVGMRVFATLPTISEEGQLDNQPGGMCLDTRGFLYVAHYGMGQVQVIDRAGKLVQTLSAGNLMSSNVAFGGPDMSQLFVTGSTIKNGPGAVFRITLSDARGLNILPRYR